jgi:hypothetical protein
MLSGVNISCALCHLDKVQFVIPGQPFHNAVISKLLYLDLSRQTFSPGLMIDYDANIACQRFGSPTIAGTFMHNLLFNMSFHLVTGFGKAAQLTLSIFLILTFV